MRLEQVRNPRQAPETSRSKQLINPENLKCTICLGKCDKTNKLQILHRIKTFLLRQYE